MEAMAEEPLPSGWLPPRAPAHPTSPEAPPRAPGNWPPPPSPSRGPQPPSSPLAVSAIAVGAAAILLLVFTAGVSYAISLVLALFAYLLARQAQRRLRAGEPGRAGQARAALVIAAVALGLAGLAALVWGILAANGITPEDLRDTLEREAQRLNRG
jgi:hypothetical protein